MGSIQKRGKNYSIVYYDNRGKQRWETVGPNKHEAKKVLSKREHDVRHGKFGKELREATFGEFASKWLETHKPLVRESTFVSYEANLRNHLLPYFKDKNLKEITREMVIAFRTDKLSEVKIAPKTINNFLVLLNSILKEAVLEDYLEANPAQYVQKVPVPYKEMDFLTKEEIHQFLANVRPENSPLFVCAVLTGMRRGELLALQWGDIDFNSSRIHVRRSLFRGKFAETKTASSRRAICMSPTLARVFKEHRLRSPQNGQELVFCSPAGNPLDGDNLVKREFHRALRKAGLRKIRFHDLRHTFAALLIDQGEHPKFIQAQMGHASIQTTLDRYGHLMPEAENGAGKRIDENLNISKTLAKQKKGAPAFTGTP